MFLPKKLHSLLIAALVATSLTIPSAAYAETAQPLPPAQSQSEETKTLAALGLIDGTTDGMLEDETLITRGQAAIVLDRVLDLEPPTELTGFLDVPAGHPAAEAVYALKAQGIVKGGAAAAFQPDAALTREQLASLFVRSLQLSDNGIQVKYTDASAIAAYHVEDAARLKQHFIIDGTAFEGKKKVTHAEFGQLLYRALSLDIYGQEGVLPIEDFIRQPAQYRFQSSPDGKSTAFLAPNNNRMNVFVKKNGESEAKPVTNATDRDIVDFAWKSDTTLIYAQDNAGDENYHVFSINVDGTGAQDLTPYPNTRAMAIDMLDNQPDEILVAMNKRDARFFDVYRLNVKTGAAELVAENPGTITGWMTDYDGKLRVAISSDGNESVLLYRDTEDQEFTELLKVGLGDTFMPAMFTYDNKQLYAMSDIGRDKAAIVQFDPATKQTVKTLYENSDVDVLSFIPSKKDGTIAAALYETDKLQYHFFDAELEKMFAKLKELVPGMEISLQEISENGDVMFFAYSDKTMGAYYTYDPKTLKAELLADVAPWIDETKMADTKPITFKARDGLELHGYLT